MEQGLDDLVLHALRSGQRDQTVRIHGVGRARDAVEDKAYAVDLPGLLDRPEYLGNALLRTELRHHVAVAIHAFGRHVRVELEGAPFNRKLGGTVGLGALEAPLADVAPRANRVGWTMATRIAGV